MAEFNLSNVKAIIFDLDGTLIDAYRPIQSSFNFTMRKLKLPSRSKSIIRKAVGWGDRQLLSPFVPAGKLTKALKIYRADHVKALKKSAKLFPEVKNLLSGLSKGYKLAVASNRPTRFSRVLINILGINKYFSFLLCADSLKRGKPAPDILLRIISHFRLTAQEVIYVGDMAIDTQTARRAGVKSIIVTTGSSSFKEIKKEKPYKIIAKIQDLRKLLNKSYR